MAVLEFAKRAVDRLAGQGYTDADEPANNVRPEKLIGETAILLYAASALGSHGEVRRRIDEIARLLIPHARSARILLGVCLEPSLALDYAEAHICLSKLGYKDAEFDELLRQSLNSQAGSGRERLPHRVLEQRWIESIWESTSRNSSRRSTAALDLVLKRPIDLLSSSRDERYAFTHALMYIRDFNIRPTRLPRPRALILSEAEAALARCLDEEDYDLGGEILMAWPLTGAAWSAGAAFGFRVLAREQDNNGVLPSRSTLAHRLDKLEGQRRDDYLLATGYHTAYVMGLLCAAALHPKRAPPVMLPAASGTDRGAANSILAILDSDGRQPAWRHHVDQIPASDREMLAGFLFNIGLHRQISRRQFAAVRELLELGYALNLIDSPAASQAAEMLERLAAFENIRASRSLS